MGHLSSKTIAVIGAGPAGLAAAEVASAKGAQVAVFDQMPSPARKLLMAGKSGLNITKSEAEEVFLNAYTGPPWLSAAVDAFGPKDVIAWMEGLGQTVFTGSTGRVFPKVMKASPLLRAWLNRLDTQGVVLHRRHRWIGWEGDALRFTTPDGTATHVADATILALGGASWSRLGSDGAWARILPDQTAPFAPSNSGLTITWSQAMGKHFGTPIKNTGLIVQNQTHRGEFTVTAKGLEGGGLYPLTPMLREGADLALDLKPDLDLAVVAERLERPRGKTSLSNHLRKTLRLTPVQIAVLREWGGLDAPLAPQIKHLPVPYSGLAPIDEAISTVGGVRGECLDETLMFKHHRGCFACGEMLDWDAPTGGYLITACLATGRLAGAAAVAYLARDTVDL
jgi:uncharacterized flavoprotein (TIGR03862 family)